MLLKYQILSVQKRHIDKINKDLYEAKLQDANDKIYDKVTLWESDWTNANITEGQEIMGEMKHTEKNGYKNSTLYPEKTQGFFPKKTNNIAQAMEKKQEGIKISQENKEFGIKIASTLRMAVDIVSASMLHDDEHETIKIQESILNWRKWLWEHWDAKDTDFNPF